MATTSRHIYVAHSDDGLYGLGEGGRVPPEIVDRYIGSSPFDWVGDETSLPLGTAMYDLMGKAAGVPVYKLFGQKVRSWVPAACWTVSTHPDRMVEAVQHYTARGFTWMKFHLSPFENVFDQTEAMEKVAPAGFRLHYDFTGCDTDDHMPDLLMRLSEHRIAGCFEDAINAGDGYIRGHQKIAAAIRCAGLFAVGNIHRARYPPFTPPCTLRRPSRWPRRRTTPRRKRGRR